MSDPLDTVFVTGSESAELKRADTMKRLVAYLKHMPVELRGAFGEQFQRIGSAELLQLRADLQAARAQVAMLDDYAETIRLHEITIEEQARQLDAARDIITTGATIYTGSANHNGAFNTLCRAWLAANPAPMQQEKP